MGAVTGATGPEDEHSMGAVSMKFDVWAELGIAVGAALDLIVAHRISGLPVLDAHDRVVCSFALLACSWSYVPASLE